MSRLIITSLQGRATGEEERFLRHWREAAPENERQYRALAELWVLTGRAEQRPEVGPPPESEFLLVRAELEEPVPTLIADTAEPRPGLTDPEGIEGGPTASPTFPVERRPGRRWGTWGALAAGFVLVSFGLGMLAQRGSLGPSVESEITTGPGELTTVTLSDGTAVRMGPSSHLRLTQNGDDWVATLEGRAFFGVVPDPSRRFTVRTRYGDAVAIGTRFEVLVEEEEFRVAVLEGSVRVSSAEVAVDVGEGLMSLTTPGVAPVTSPVLDMMELLDWMGLSLLFRETPLEKAIGEIERVYGVQIVLEDPHLAALTVTATLTGQGLENVISVVCGIIGAECEVAEDRIRVREDSGTVAPRELEGPVAGRWTRSSPV